MIWAFCVTLRKKHRNTAGEMSGSRNPPMRISGRESGRGSACIRAMACWAWAWVIGNEGLVGAAAQPARATAEKKSGVRRSMETGESIADANKCVKWREVSRNPKPEIRMTNQIRMTKSEWLFIGHWDFGLDSSFGFRISNFPAYLAGPWVWEGSDMVAA